MIEFRPLFRALTGYDPFPWQKRLYHEFVEGRFHACHRCSLPTGMGKTSLLSIWLIALAHRPDNVPRRLVYVVNRRTVVDQTTDEAEKICKALDNPALIEFRKSLTQLYSPADRDELPLALSTLRGQFADNRKWSANPARPAIICGTVDMIGSRLLFSGYGVGFKLKPLHAGFLGHDVLLIHDEAHLEPAFQTLLETIEKEQATGRFPDFDEQRRLKIIELTATTRSGDEGFKLEADDYRHPEIQKRLRAAKQLKIHLLDEEKRLADRLIECALEHRESGQAILVFARYVEAVDKIAERLRKAYPKAEEQSVTTLTGTMRGKERDELATKDEVFARFLPDSKCQRREGTVYLVCTSAGEVGINLSADHLVCDLTTYESMAQRFGRVNRFGNFTDTRIDVVAPKSFGKGDKIEPLDERRKRTLELLLKLDGDASPQALSHLSAQERAAAFAPLPKMLTATEILFDSWSMTTIRGKLPGRPDVEPYLHGEKDWEPPVTQVAWREEVGIVTGELREKYPPAELLEDFPLKPHELLQERSDRVFKNLVLIAERKPDTPVWLVDDQGSVEVIPALAELTQYNRKEHLESKIVLLCPTAGGLEGGFLNGKSSMADDVADEWFSNPDNEIRRRWRFWEQADDDSKQKVAFSKKMRRIRKPIQLHSADEENNESDEGSEASKTLWHWFELPTEGDTEGSRTARKPVWLTDHLGDVVEQVERIVAPLPLSPQIKAAVIAAAAAHDLGKDRESFQNVLGNFNQGRALAKSKDRSGPIQEKFRHEFGSLVDVVREHPGAIAFTKLDVEMQDLALHLIAAHHGRGRPHFTLEEALDRTASRELIDRITLDVSLRFVRLQKKYGRWGLAYLESLLRAADYVASAFPTFAEAVEAELA
ncbi:type I-G CRISPR-associated helicase/endonuclease Cas3g [Planctomicrobium sp. SH664]|uniref:type I-G CRISPR-associated helicase/endonuclease Cas3g n=1 Tax=Planctomicrobium sp. SH664 TaxID=3448125 RepID=UPI003F5BD482